MTTATKPKTSSTVVTTIPTEETTQPQTVLFSVTEETIKRFEGYRELRVDDITNKGQLKAVHDARMELVKARTSVDRVRKEMNDDHQRQIKLNNEKAKGLLSLFEPIELHLKNEEDRVEAALEAERVAARNALLNGRKKLLADVVGEFTDMLLIYPDDVLLGMGESVFNPLLVTLGVQVEGRQQLAIQQAQQKAREEQAAKELAERERAEKEARENQQAIEDAERKAAQEKLDAERAEFDARRKIEQQAAWEEAERIRKTVAAEREAFDKQQREAAELQRKADEERATRIAQEDAYRELREANRLAEENARLAAERAELESQRMAIEDERRKQEAIREEQSRLLREAELRAENERIESERAARVRAEEMLRQQNAEVERQRLESLRPDLDKLTEWLERIGESFTENLPVMSTEGGQEKLVDLQAAMVESMGQWRGMLE